MLETQYRMHPLIRQWPSEAFYHGRLVDGPSAVVRVPPRCLPRPVVYCEVAGQDEKAQGGKSRANPAEVAAAVGAVEALRGEVEAEQIAVVTPYRGQARGPPPRPPPRFAARPTRPPRPRKGARGAQRCVCVCIHI